MGDFNQDGNLDFPITQDGIAVFLGNGDGSFQPEVDYPIVGFVANVVAVDLNHDRRLDLIVPSDPPPAVAELFGNGDGTFQPPMFYQNGVGGGPVVGDFNGDGKLDLALLNGDRGVTTMLGTGVLTFSPSAPLVFPLQAVNTTSTAKTVTLTNNGTTAVSFRSLNVTGEFQVTANSCGNNLAAGATCEISVVCKPTMAGHLSGQITLRDSASSKPQMILLRGRATPLTVSPRELNFGSQKVGTTSPPQMVTVTNQSNSSVTFDAIFISGSNAGDFMITSETCSPQLPAGASCMVTITFSPTKTGSRSASSYVNIAGGINPKPVSLVGTGT